jgi:hypothetical protein
VCVCVWVCVCVCVLCGALLDDTCVRAQSCDDGNPCTSPDLCSASGQCGGSNVCGCNDTTTATAPSAQCDTDHNMCTVKTCNNMVCETRPAGV